MGRLLGGVPAAPPPEAAKTRGAYGGDSNFDTNMVIILAALLCALICALGLNSIVRCALRCGRRMAFETPEEAAARLAGTGLKKRTLRQIPVAIYGQGATIPATECPICLGEFADGEKVRLLPRCNHGFHVRCIDTWLASHSSCPTCRHSLLDRAAGGGGEARLRGNNTDLPGGVAAAIALDQQGRHDHISLWTFWQSYSSFRLPLLYICYRTPDAAVKLWLAMLFFLFPLVSMSSYGVALFWYTRTKQGAAIGLAPWCETTMLSGPWSR